MERNDKIMKGIFINKNSQVRSGWKIASTFLTFFVLTTIITLIIMTGYVTYMLSTKQIGISEVQSFTKNLTNGNSSFTTIAGIIQCLLMILSVLLFWKVFDKKPIREIGLINIKNGYKDLIKGLILGASSLIIVFLILLVTKNILLVNPLTKPNFSPSLFTGVILFIFVGINEELFARGYCMTVLKQTGNRWVVVIVSAMIFSLLHFFNPSMNFFSYLNLFLFGLFTAYMFVKSGNLWLSIGCHITWNYFEGNVFGFQVSGQSANGLYNVHNTVNNIINGGNFGPEGGLVVTFILFVGLIYMWKFYKPSISQNSNIKEFFYIG